MVNNDTEELAKAIFRHNHAQMFLSTIKEPFQETILALQLEDESSLIESDSAILTLIFAHIDLLGCLYKGNNSSRNAVDFIRGYLGRIDSRYKEIGGLLYEALRHGLVHLFTPKRILLKNDIVLDFSFSRFRVREKNFKVFKTQEIQHTGDNVIIFRLVVSVALLYEDLLSAMDLYADDIRQNQEISDRFWTIFESRRKPEHAKEEDLLNKKTKAYLLSSDFDYVRSQIANIT